MIMKRLFSPPVLQLDYLTTAQLKGICKGLCVTVGGNKSELISKIKDKLS